MTNDGRLTFLEQPWWPRAQKLAEGQSFTLDLNHDGRPDTIITRRDDDIIEAIDDSGHAKDNLEQGRYRLCGELSRHRHRRSHGCLYR